MKKKRHRSAEAGGGQSFAAAKSRIQMPEEMEGVSDCSVPKDDEPYHSRRSLLDDEMDNLVRDSDESSSSSSDVPEQRVVHTKKKQVKRWDLVSSSDAEADTVKDRFWRNLEEGVLPEDLVDVDLYSSVCS